MHRGSHVQVPDDEAAVLRFALCDIYRHCTELEDTQTGSLLSAEERCNPDETFYRANYVVLLETIDTKLLSLKRQMNGRTYWFFAEAGLQSGMGAK